RPRRVATNVRFEINGPLRICPGDRYGAAVRTGVEPNENGLTCGGAAVFDRQGPLAAAAHENAGAAPARTRTPDGANTGGAGRRPKINVRHRPGAPGLHAQRPRLVKPNADGIRRAPRRAGAGDCHIAHRSEGTAEKCECAGGRAAVFDVEVSLADAADSQL